MPWSSSLKVFPRGTPIELCFEAYARPLLQLQGGDKELARPEKNGGSGLGVV
jgi:hypothetical protein